MPFWPGAILLPDMGIQYARDCARLGSTDTACRNLTRIIDDVSLPHPHGNLLYYGVQLGDFHASKPSTSHLYLYEKKKRACSPRILPDTGAASDPRGTHATESGGSRGNDRDGCGPRDAPWIHDPLRPQGLLLGRCEEAYCRLLAVAMPMPRGLRFLHSTSIREVSCTRTEVAPVAQCYCRTWRSLGTPATVLMRDVAVVVI